LREARRRDLPRGVVVVTFATPCCRWHACQSARLRWSFSFYSQVVIRPAIPPPHRQLPSFS